ncbi:hypothetical protein [Nocardioides sp. SR21]|uniref:hypothetical protein n=1 Tax=Nocardioides sp. SR21 TaxID=2919501 RepID=UPI001FA95973|nr:hypothetical protein [Nocardioides sp. SR21]
MGDKGEQQRTPQPVEEETPTPPDVDMEPEDHVNRPDQPDFDPDEREQYETPIAEAVIPEDR